MLKRRSFSSTGDEMPLMRLTDCVAKTIKISDDLIIKGADVLTHCLITGMVAKEMIKRQPQWLRDLLYPEGTELLAAVHDAGKIFPSFQKKIHKALRSPEFPEGQELGIANPVLNIRHEAVSHATFYNYSRFIPEIVGRHHGYSPESTGMPDDEIFGGAHWQKMRLELVEYLKNALQTDLPVIKSAVHADVLSGFLCVADWISSGAAFENITAEMIGKPDFYNQIVSAVDTAGFVKPKLKKGLSFKSAFGFQPREIQLRLFEIADDSGIYILEAPMGLGKTEAALYAAYKALEQERATGIYFALPTQLTSNKIYERMNKFLSIILEDDGPHRKSLLLHGTAWLKQSEMGEEGLPGRSWFSSPKRGLLAPFAVGTIDQALMAAINVKHGFVRTFGLAGKVVILDEVHSYDSYTGTLLNELVKILKDIGCTVIILSATLTEKRRRDLLNSENQLSDKIYPLISSVKKNDPPEEYRIDYREQYEVQLKVVVDQSWAIHEALNRAESGQQVLWIENTVDEAQQMLKKIGAMAQNYGIEYGLLHSRFLKNERELKENYWVNIYGKNAGEKRKTCGRILVGTQVLEQSLDIDADFLITRLCPTDMLFQRLGRLWRHRQNDPFRPSGSAREAIILSPDINDAFLKDGAFEKSGYVYSPYILCRTLEIWKDLSEVLIPQQIPDLIEATYEDRDENGLLSLYKDELIKKRETLQRLAINGLSRFAKTLPETKASTRYSEIECIDVLLIKSKHVDSDGSTHLRFIDGTGLVLPRSIKSSGKKAQREAAALLMSNTVTVPERLAPTFKLSQMTFLKDYVYLGDDEHSPFRAVIVQPDGEFSGLGGDEAHEKYRLLYNDTLGYIAVKK